tara:strand:+ start:592 stop:801 length:210 start_codon:yes stop_codon:yes gene_type:complete
LHKENIMANKEIIFTFDGTDISVELGKGFRSGSRAEVEADKYLKGIAVKDKVSHKPHVHTESGQVIYTG